MNRQFHGTGVALATPLNTDYSIDFEGLEKLVEHTISGGVDYLVVQGTTGESPTMSWKEKLQILSKVISFAEKRVPVVFGLGGNNTFDLIEKSKKLAEYDIDAILSVSPYYSKPSQAGIINHFTMLADSFPQPIILYNVPARTSSNMLAETTLELATHENIIGMKEASHDFDQCKKIIDNKPQDFLLLSGEDSMTHELVAAGAEGVISVIANLIPDRFSQMVNTALNGELGTSKSLDEELMSAYESAGKEGNPTSLKSGLKVRGICDDIVRPPLAPGSQTLRAEWEELLEK